VIASILLSLAAVQPQTDADAWRTLVSGASVQWGALGEGRRGLRVECRTGGRLLLLGPTAADSLPGTPVRVTFRRGDEHVTLLAVTVDTGDGPSFEVPLMAAELPITTLLAGANLTISEDDESFEVPGAGAPAVLAPLVEACRR
jgi:hypothetical protein